MTASPPDRVTTPAVPPRAFVRELRAILILGVPLAATQLGQILVHTTEVVLLGRAGPELLAGATLGFALYHPMYLFNIGVVSATGPLIAQAHGARRPREERRAVRQGLWMALALSLPLAALLWFAAPAFLLAIGQDPEIVPHTAGYLRFASFGLPFGAGFIVLRNLTSAYDRTRTVLIATYAAVALNIPLSWAFIFGELGAPAMGTAGAGLGVAVTMALMFVFLLLQVLTRRPFRRLHVLSRFWKPDWPTFIEILRVGLPIALAMLMEVSLFASGALLMGLIGKAELAAHQVAIQLASISFMVPLGLSYAATIRVGIAIGAADLAQARRAGTAALLIGATFMMSAAALFALAGGALVSLFFASDTAQTALARDYAVGFLRIAALFQLVDGIQVIAIASLRGLKDTRVPLLLAAFSYWLVGFPLGWLLAFHTALQGKGIWIGLAAALATAAILLVIRFERLTRAPAAGIAAPAQYGYRFIKP